MANHAWLTWPPCTKSNTFCQHGKAAGLFCLDFSRALDTASHCLLLYKLARYKLNGQPVREVGNWLTGSTVLSGSLCPAETSHCLFVNELKPCLLAAIDVLLNESIAIQTASLNTLYQCQIAISKHGWSNPCVYVAQSKSISALHKTWTDMYEYHSFAYP